MERMEEKKVANLRCETTLRNDAAKRRCEMTEGEERNPRRITVWNLLDKSSRRIWRRAEGTDLSSLLLFLSLKEGNSIICEEHGIINGRNSRLLRSRSGAESPRSLDSVRSRQIPSPLRTPRSIPSPSFDSSDDTTIRIDRATFQYMFQDIVSLKTMLLKLKRVLQEVR